MNFKETPPTEPVLKTGCLFPAMENMGLRNEMTKTEAEAKKLNLRSADLRSADLRSADLSGADLSDANLSGADLSGCKNLKTASEFLVQFERDQLGIIVFRSKDGDRREKPGHWQFEQGAVLTEVVNPCRTTFCGSGVSFGTLPFVKKNYNGPYWRCRIRFIDLADVVVPFGTDGKARCARLELLEAVF